MKVADGFEQYHAPHDPGSSHQLHWTPGNFGKGLLTHDGVLHHWNTTRFEDGNPFHKQYCQDHGIPDNSYTPFWISPQGGVTSLPNQSADWRSVADLDPRLDLNSVDKEKWKFAAFPNQQRALEGIPQIIDDEPGGWEGGKGDEKSWDARRPFIYNQPEHTVYVGKPGEHHGDLTERHRLRNGMYDLQNHYEGYAMKGLGDHPDEVAFYRSQPANPKPILEALSEHLDVPVSDPLGDDLWKFAWTEEEQELRKRDPLTFEKQVDWDRPGDVGHHPDVEWVPTHELKKFIEHDRRPGSVHQPSPDRYQALADHILNEGFKNPVQLEFNQDTGMAHMGEGNHRTWIALEHGIPAMPVRVNRGRRTSPTQIPVNLQTLPEWEDKYDPSGYHIPPSMKPSHIGLPTVPSPNQKTAAAGDELHWTPGVQGKGLVAPDSSVHTWNTSNGIYPAHYEYKADVLGLDLDTRQASEFWINPNGDVSFYLGIEGTPPGDIEDIKMADPRLNVTDLSNNDVANDWKFSKVA